MLNPRTFAVPSIGSQSILRPSIFQTIPNSIYEKNSPQTFYLSESKKNEYTVVNQPNSLISRPIRVVNCNNMYQQVKWFDLQNSYQTIIKIVTTWLLAFILVIIDTQNFSLFFSLCAFSFFLIGLQSNFFGNSILRRWAQIILAITTLLLSKNILVNLVYLMSNKVAENLTYKSFQLIPSFLVTSMLTVVYLARPLMSLYLPKKLKQALKIYVTSFIQYFYSLWELKIIILQVYSLTFLGMYLCIASLNFYYIVFNPQKYTNLIHPIVFLAQILTFIIIATIYHFIMFFIESLFTWTLTPKFYSQVNGYTGIPTIVQMLNIKQTQQIRKQLQNRNLLNNFNIFSLPQSRKNNNLNLKQMLNINKHSLCWILNYILRNDGNIKRNMSIYANTNSLQISQPKKQVNYWQYVCQFANQHIKKTLLSLVQLLSKVRKLQNEKEKSLYQDLFYYFRNWKSNLQIKMTSILCAQYLNICDHIFEIIALTQIRIEQQTGKTIQLYKNIEQLKNICNAFDQFYLISEIIKSKMKKIHNKSIRILRKAK